MKGIYNKVNNLVKADNCEAIIRCSCGEEAEKKIGRDWYCTKCEHELKIYNAFNQKTLFRESRKSVKCRKARFED